MGRMTPSCQPFLLIAFNLCLFILCVCISRTSAIDIETVEHEKREYKILLETSISVDDNNGVISNRTFQLLDNGVSLSKQVYAFTDKHGLQQYNYAFLRYVDNLCKSHKVNAPDVCQYLNQYDKLTLTEFASALGDVNCLDKTASAGLKKWFSTRFTENDFNMWYRPFPLTADKQYEYELVRDHRGFIPCDSKFWVDGNWLPRPMWLLREDKGISPFRCPDDELWDVGLYQCENVSNALRYECTGAFNYLCRSYFNKLVVKGDCLVYTIGIGGSWEFEDFMAQNLGCEVHSFDPSPDPLLSKHLSHDVEGVFFHPIGVKGEIEDNGRRPSFVWSDDQMSKEAETHMGMLTLEQIWHYTGHAAENRMIDVIRIDCEGCEWETFHQIATESPHILAKTSILIIEFHVSFVASLTPDEYMKLIVSFWENYVRRFGFRIWFAHSFMGAEVFESPISISRRLEEFGFEKRKCCYEVGFYREIEDISEDL